MVLAIFAVSNRAHQIVVAFVPVAIAFKQVLKTKRLVTLQMQVVAVALNGNLLLVATVRLALMILAAMANGVAAKVDGAGMTITKARQIALYGAAVVQHVAVCTDYGKIIVICHQAQSQNVILGTIFIICAGVAQQAATLRLITPITGAALYYGQMV